MDLDVPYGITRKLKGTSIDRARALVTDALRVEGFGVLTEIDVAATLKAKLGVDRDPYLILGACNPKLAREALDREPAAGLLLPCNIVLAVDGPDVLVSAASPRSMFGIIGDASRLAPVAEEAEARLRCVMASLERGSEATPASVTAGARDHDASLGSNVLSHDALK